LRKLLGECAIPAGCADGSTAGNAPGLARYNARRGRTLHASVSPAADGDFLQFISALSDNSNAASIFPTDLDFREAGANMQVRNLTFAKSGHTFVFRYAPGYEDEVVDEIMQLAEDEDCSLDWLDAATLSFQIAQHAAGASPDALTTLPEDFAQ